MWWQNKQHDRHTQTRTHKHTQSVQAPCPVIWCNLELWQFTDFGVELAELAVCSRSFQPPVMDGNDTLKISAHTYEPATYVYALHSSGQHQCKQENMVVNIKCTNVPLRRSSVIYSSFSKQSWKAFNSLSSLGLFVSCGNERSIKTLNSSMRYAVT